MVDVFNIGSGHSHTARVHKYAVGGDDRLFYRRVLGEFPEILARLDDRHRTPTEDLRLIARSRAVLAMRFHSVVFSLATKTPFLAVDYTLGGKIEGLLNDLGLQHLLISIARFEGVSAATRLVSLEEPAADLSTKIAEAESTLEKCFACIPLTAERNTGESLRRSERPSAYRSPSLPPSRRPQEACWKSP
jgi:polysaccharide pyruvyl transferase WcaK-like protein